MRHIQIQDCLRFYPSKDTKNDRLLVFFPHAGGAASSFLPLVDEFTKYWQLAIVQYPGRECRFGTDVDLSIEGNAIEVIEALKHIQYRSLTCFGHSMGAKIAFESARLMKKIPTLLIVSCSPAPDSLSLQNLSLDDSNANLIKYMKLLGGMHPKLLENEDLMDMILAIVRTDFHMLHKYTTQIQMKKLIRLPIDIPIIGLIAKEDPVVNEAEVCRWKHWTTTEFSPLHIVGNHFYFQDTSPGVFRDYIQKAHRLGSH